MSTPQRSPAADEPPGTPGLDTLVRRAEERLRQLQLAEVTPDSTHRSTDQGAPPNDAHHDALSRQESLLRRSLHAESAFVSAGAGAEGTHHTQNTLRSSMAAESAFVPVPPNERSSFAGEAGVRALAEGEVPEWLRPEGGALGGARGGRSSGCAPPDSRGSSATEESTGTALARRAEQQHERVAQYEDKLGALQRGEVVDTIVPRPRSQGGGRRAPPPNAIELNTDRPYTEWSHGATPALTPGRSDAAGLAGTAGEGIEGRMQWLRQLEAQLGMEGVVIPSDDAASASGSRPASASRRPPSASVGTGTCTGTGTGTGLVANAEARLRRLERLEAGVEEKEELDDLLTNYLQQ